MPIPRRLVFCCVFLLLPVFLPGERFCRAADAPASSSVSPYDRALREAEEDLRRLTREEEASGGWGMGELLSVVALVAALGLMLVAMRWSKGAFRRPGGREMRLVDRMMLGRNTSLVLVRLRGREYWLAESPNAVTVLADWPAPENAAPAKSETPG